MSSSLSTDPSTSSRQRSLDRRRSRFEELLHEVAPSLFGYAHLRIPAPLRTVIDAEDLVQAAFCEAFMSFNSFDPRRATFRQWVFGIARTLLKNALRHHYRRSPKIGTNVGSGHAAIERIADQATSISRRVALDEELQLFLDRVSALREPDRSLVLHHGLNGLTLDESARLLGITREASKKRWQRVRARLAGLGVPRGFIAHDSEVPR